jgi:hypothetical protein
MNRPRSSSIKEFCARHRINPATFYRRRDLMPATISVAGQKRILDEDERAWIDAHRETGRAA